MAFYGAMSLCAVELRHGCELIGGVRPRGLQPSAGADLGTTTLNRDEPSIQIATICDGYTLGAKSRCRAAEVV